MRSLCHGLHTNSDGGGPLVGLMVGKWLDSNQIMPQKPLHCRIDTAELAYDKFRLSQNELGSECPKMCVCVCGTNGCLEEFHLIADLWQVTLTIPRFAIGTLYCQGRHLSSQIPQDN